ncbi:chemotaxis protein CheB [Rufibacter psychrotolerans]|uniref:chemotaxis protein CheB n=1 Tax=Rufibacter psychrotolerans TaxID=2812556 RepID=UPI00196862EA|nr:chemotaxis protein CheB [Rufibacter sp. SYSU D00308]
MIGDTSVRSRLVLSGMIEAEPRLEVVDTARSREELIFKAMAAKPDLIVAHHGLTMSGSLPLFKPVYGQDSALLLMVSQEMAEGIFYLPRTFRVNGHEARPATVESTGAAGGKAGLMSTLREFVVRYSDPSPAPVVRKKEAPAHSAQSGARNRVRTSAPGQAPLKVVVIGASTGGSLALEAIVRELSAPQPAVVLVAVHMPEKFTKRLAQRLQKCTNWRVEEGYQGMKLSAGTIVIAPGGQNMRVKRSPLRAKELTIALEPSAAMDTPSVDVLMASAAQCAPARVLGVILTGMGQDGTAGAREIMNQGGTVIAQNRETSTIFGMAKSAIESGVVHGVVALGQIHSIIHRFTAGPHMSQALQRNYKG